MTDRLSRSNSQSDLPNYGQGQQDDKNKDVGKKRMAPLPNQTRTPVRAMQIKTKLRRK